MKVKNLVKVLLLFLVASLAICSLAINVEVDGTKVNFDVEPQLVQGRTMVPLRAIFVALGVEPEWDGTTQTVTANSNNVDLSMKVGDTYAMINGKRVSLDVPAMLINSRTMVPTRFIAESLGANVEWDGVRNTVLINKNKNKSIGNMNVSLKDNGLNIRGNTVGNLSNAGKVAMQGDSIYYNEQDKLYRKDLNTGSKQMLYEKHQASADFINVVGDWVYFTSQGIYRIRIDGTNLEKLNDNRSSNLSVINGWIYYLNHGLDYRGEDGTILFKDRGLYRMRIDGTEKQLITKDFATYVNVVDNYIYYSNYSDNDRLYRVSIDGTEIEKLNDERSIYINVIDGWVYYNNMEGEDAFFRIRIDGSDRQVISGVRPAYINISNGWVYYANTFDYHKLYRCRIDGSEVQKLSDEWAHMIWVFGDNLFYKSRYDDFDLYQISIDGSGKKVFSKNS